MSRKHRRIVLSDSDEEPQQVISSLTPTQKLASDLNDLNFICSNSNGTQKKNSLRCLDINSDDDMDPYVARSAMMGDMSPTVRKRTKRRGNVELEEEPTFLVPNTNPVTNIASSTTSPLSTVSKSLCGSHGHTSVGLTSHERCSSGSRSAKLTQRKALRHKQLAKDFEQFKKSGLEAITFDLSEDEVEVTELYSSESSGDASDQDSGFIVDDEEEEATDDDDDDDDDDIDGYSNDGDSVSKRRCASRTENSSSEVHNRVKKRSSSQLMYLKLNAQRDEAEDDDAYSLNFRSKSLPMADAMTLYMEMIGRILVNQDFRNEMGTGKKLKSRHVPYFNASRQLENLICTHRESLLGSSAWKHDFLTQLRARPFNMSRSVGSQCANEFCQACGRSSQNADILMVLFGPTYDAEKCWSSTRWVGNLPDELFCIPSSGEHEMNLNRSRNKGLKRSASPSCSSSKKSRTDSGPGDMASPDSTKQQWWQKYLPRKFATHKESQWWVATHCKNRTHLYHTLLHYKFRLALKIREYLESHSPVDLEEADQEGLDALVDIMTEDHKFQNQELRRLESLLSSAGSKYGGERFESLEQTDIWYADSLRSSSSNSEFKSKESIKKMHGKKVMSPPKVQSTLTSWLKR